MENIHPQSSPCQAQAPLSPKKLCQLRELFGGQARLLADRAERGLQLDMTSLERLIILGELIELEGTAHL